MPCVSNGDKLRDFIVDMATAEEDEKEDNTEAIKNYDMG